MRRMLALPPTLDFRRVARDPTALAGLAACDPAALDRAADRVAADVARDGYAVLDGCFDAGFARLAAAEFARTGTTAFRPAEVGVGAAAGVDGSRRSDAVYWLDGADADRPLLSALTRARRAMRRRDFSGLVFCGEKGSPRDDRASGTRQPNE